MHIVDTTRFVIAILFAGVGAALLLVSRGTSGFDRRKQAGVMALIASGIFFAAGFGYIQVR